MFGAVFMMMHCMSMPVSREQPYFPPPDLPSSPLCLPPCRRNQQRELAAGLTGDHSNKGSSRASSGGGPTPLSPGARSGGVPGSWRAAGGEGMPVTWNPMFVHYGNGEGRTEGGARCGGNAVGWG